MVIPKTRRNPDVQNFIAREETTLPASNSMSTGGVILGSHSLYLVSIQSLRGARSISIPHDKRTATPVVFYRVFSGGASNRFTKQPRLPTFAQRQLALHASTRTQGEAHPCRR